MAINEKSEKFWYGVDDKVIMEEYKGVVEYGENGGVWKSMNGGKIGNFWQSGELGQVWGEYGRSGGSGEMWREDPPLCVLYKLFDYLFCV